MFSVSCLHRTEKSFFGKLKQAAQSTIGKAIVAQVLNVAMKTIGANPDCAAAITGSINLFKSAKDVKKSKSFSGAVGLAKSAQSTFNSLKDCAKAVKKNGIANTLKAAAANAVSGDCNASTAGVVASISTLNTQLSKAGKKKTKKNVSESY